MSLMVSVEVSLRGCPLSPPLSPLCSLCKSSGRRRVVLVTMRPSADGWGRGLDTTAAMSSLSCCVRSGDIFTRSGGRWSGGNVSLSAIT